MSAFIALGVVVTELNERQRRGLTIGFTPVLRKELPAIRAACARSVDYVAFASLSEREIEDRTRDGSDRYLKGEKIRRFASIRGRILAWNCVTNEPIVPFDIPLDRQAAASDTTSLGTEVTVVAVVAGIDPKRDLWRPAKTDSTVPITAVCVLYLPRRQVIGPIGIEPAYTGIRLPGRGRVHTLGDKPEYPEARIRHGFEADAAAFVGLLLDAEG